MKKITSSNKVPPSAKSERALDFWQCYQCYRIHEGRRSKKKVCECCGYPSKAPD